MFRYIENIIQNPDMEKYRKIKKSNKVFSEKVVSVEGSEEFLSAVGFKPTLLKSPKDEGMNHINDAQWFLYFIAACLFASSALLHTSDS